MYVKKCLKAYQPKYYQENKERVQKNLAKDVKIYLMKKKKKAALWSWALQKSLRGWKTKVCWV